MNVKWKIQRILWERVTLPVSLGSGKRGNFPRISRSLLQNNSNHCQLSHFVYFRSRLSICRKINSVKDTFLYYVSYKKKKLLTSFLRDSFSSDLICKSALVNNNNRPLPRINRPLLQNNSNHCQLSHFVYFRSRLSICRKINSVKDTFLYYVSYKKKKLLTSFLRDSFSSDLVCKSALVNNKFL